MWSDPQTTILPSRKFFVAMTKLIFYVAFYWKVVYVEEVVRKESLVLLLSGGPLVFMQVVTQTHLRVLMHMIKQAMYN